MKKVIAIALILLMTLSLAACGGVVEKNSSGECWVNPKKIDEIVEIIELTTDNWDEYLTVVQRSYIEQRVDEWGDIISHTMRH